MAGSSSYLPAAPRRRTYFQDLRRLHLDQALDDGRALDALIDLQKRVDADLDADFLLIDARTGITSTNAVTTHVLADEVVALTLDAPEQLEGTRSVLRSLHPLTSIRTGEPISLLVVLTRVPPRPGTASLYDLTDPEKEQARRVLAQLNEPAQPLDQTLDVRQLHVLHTDLDLTRSEFLTFARTGTWTQSVFHVDNRFIARALFGADVEAAESAAVEAAAGDPDRLEELGRYFVIPSFIRGAGGMRITSIEGSTGSGLVVDAPTADRDESEELAWERDSAEAEGLLRYLIADDSRRAADALTAPANTLTDAERHDLRALSVAKNEMGETLRQRKSPECVSYYQEAIELAVRAEDRTGEAFTTYNLASAFVEIRVVRDLDEAERLYLRCLSLVDDTQTLFTARIIGQLGMIGLARYDDEVGRASPDGNPGRYLEKARKQYEWALSKIPADARRSRAEAHGQLGIVYAKMAAPDVALAHFQQAISHDVAIDDRFGAGLGRSNAAILLMQVQRLDDALEYARSALADFESLGGRAAENVEETSALVATLEQWVALERGG